VAVIRWLDVALARGVILPERCRWSVEALTSLPHPQEHGAFSAIRRVSNKAKKKKQKTKKKDHNSITAIYARNDRPRLHGSWTKRLTKQPAPPSGTGNDSTSPINGQRSRPQLDQCNYTRPALEPLTTHPYTYSLIQYGTHKDHQEERTIDE
jgi:hypothetical protein